MGWKAARNAALGCGVALICLQSPAMAQGLSAKSVQKIMDYAWAFTPDRFTRPNGQTIAIDKKKREAVMVPLDTAREVIRVGRLSALAQSMQAA